MRELNQAMSSSSNSGAGKVASSLNSWDVTPSPLCTTVSSHSASQQSAKTIAFSPIPSVAESNNEVLSTGTHGAGGSDGVDSNASLYFNAACVAKNESTLSDFLGPEGDEDQSSISYTEACEDSVTELLQVILVSA